MIRFVIPDMTCQGCVGSVARAVQGVDPAAQVSADLDQHTIAIELGRDRRGAGGGDHRGRLQRPRSPRRERHVTPGLPPVLPSSAASAMPARGAQPGSG